MADPHPITIVNVGYRSTNYWVISRGSSRVLVDLGWPGSMGVLQANLRRVGIPLREIRYGLATHYHIDHAGLAQELKAAGVGLLVMESQVQAIPLMKAFTKPWDRYADISLDGNRTIPFEASRELLESVGFEGEVLPTPGHSDDSVTLMLDDGSAFTGDLTPEDAAYGPQASTVLASWQRLRQRGATRIYPGHGPVRPLPPHPPALTPG